PVIEFCGGGAIQGDAMLVAGVAQQKPLLLLADTERFGLVADQIARQAIAQPATGTGEDFHILLVQAHFLVKLAIERLLCAFTLLNAALGKLPRVVSANAPGPENLGLGIDENDPDIGAETFRIDHDVLLK